jgi:hypothetical protein
MLGMKRLTYRKSSFLIFISFLISAVLYAVDFRLAAVIFLVTISIIGIIIEIVYYKRSIDIHRGAIRAKSAKRTRNSGSIRIFEIWMLEMKKDQFCKFIKVILPLIFGWTLWVFVKKFNGGYQDYSILYLIFVGISVFLFSLVIYVAYLSKINEKMNQKYRRLIYIVGCIAILLGINAELRFASTGVVILCGIYLFCTKEKDA